MKNLKVMIMTLMMCLTMFITSCEKEEIEKEEIKPCNCGTIANDGIDNGCYWLEIRNDCSGNKKKFCFDQDVWMNAYVGTNLCVANEPQW